MAKFKIEVELDYTDYDSGSIDEIIFNRLVSKIVDKMSENNEKSIISAVSEELAKKVNETLDKVMNEFMDREIVVTDSWGDIVEKHGNVKDLLKAKFDDFLVEKVDKNGAVLPSSKCHYGTTMTRLEKKLDDMVKTEIDTFVKTMERKTTNDIESILNKKTQEMISASIGKAVAENIDLFGVKK